MRKISSTNQPAKSLTDQAYERLSQDIRTCKMQPGSEISEGEVADILGMSKTPIREALGRLALEGFVTPLPRRGYQITPLTIDDLTELFEIRGILESAIIEDVIERISTSELDELERLAEISYDPEVIQTIGDFIAANREFHLAIARAHQNQRILAIAERQFDELERYFYLGARTNDIGRQTNRDHLSIVEALRKRDLQAARNAIIEHNFSTHNHVLSALAAPRLRRTAEAPSIRP